MQNGARKIGADYRQTLGARDRDQRHIRKGRIEQLQIGQILTAVQRRHSVGSRPAKQRKMELIHMEV